MRSAMLCEALKGNVAVTPNVCLVGIDEDTAYLQHTLTEQPVILENIIATVLSCGNVPVKDLTLDAIGADEIYEIGECVAARTVEEAIFEGLQVGTRI